jgi:hypothetical protein
MKFHTPILASAVLGLSIASTAGAEERPVPYYAEGTGELTVPLADVEGMPGHFQDIKLVPAGEDLWELTEFKEGQLLDVITEVTAIQSNETPAQVLLRIDGQFPTGCGQIGYVREKHTENQIDVSIFYLNDLWLENPAVVLCTQAVRPFTKVVPLSVYGLEAGTYTYEVNGEFSGQFTLQEDNVIPADTTAPQA